MIVIDHLTKRYGAATAVSDVSFTCRPGNVTGFLSPNGAGKSTPLRLLCGLANPTSGTATVLGVPFARPDQPGRRVGVLLDASAQHPGRTGREALLLDSPAAIVVNVVIPIAWAILAGSPSALHGVQPWLDQAKATENLLGGRMDAHRWAQIGVVALVWVVALIGTGLIRLRRKEIA